MTDHTFRALTLGLLASTALATPALAQTAQPETTGQSPAPATNATDVTAAPPKVQQAQEAAGAPGHNLIVIKTNERGGNTLIMPRVATAFRQWKPVLHVILA